MAATFCLAFRQLSLLNARGLRTKSAQTAKYLGHLLARSWRCSQRKCRFEHIKCSNLGHFASEMAATFLLAFGTLSRPNASGLRTKVRKIAKF